MPKVDPDTGQPVTDDPHQEDESARGGKLSDGTYAAALSGATVAASAFSYSPNLLYPTVGCGCQVSANRTMSSQCCAQRSP